LSSIFLGGIGFFTRSRGIVAFCRQFKVARIPEPGARRPARKLPIRDFHLALLTTFAGIVAAFWVNGNDATI